MVLDLTLLVFPLFLPGFLLVNVLVPGRRSLGGDYDLLYRVFFGVVLSVAITLLYGTVLIVLGGTDQVFLRPETLWPGLALIALALFLAGLARGAYPPIVRLLGRSPAPSATEAPDEEDVFGR
ncbi:MAG: hypothetical protein R3291_01170, partial [Thermoplasmata archaeon]|nr:hypothetical protein [Thermoplasmata archaeon]